MTSLIFDQVLDIVLSTDEDKERVRKLFGETLSYKILTVLVSHISEEQKESFAQLLEGESVTPESVKDWMDQNEIVLDENKEKEIVAAFETAYKEFMRELINSADEVVKDKIAGLVNN